MAEISDILHRATATAAFHNSKERFDPPKCHPKTRIAVLDKIMRWIKWEGDLESFIMWVYGPAGAGKSAGDHRWHTDFPVPFFYEKGFGILRRCSDMTFPIRG